MSNYIVLLLLFGGILEITFSKSLKQCKEDIDKIENDSPPLPVIPVIYHDLESVIRVLKHPKHYSQKAVQELLDIYYDLRDKTARFEASGGTKNYPLIVVEGLSGAGKTTISTGLAKEINGTYVHTPPKNLKQLKSLLKKNRVVYNAFHYLCEYITGQIVTPMLQDSSVILDRYWYSPATYSIARTVLYNPEENKMPPKGNKDYIWPEDLLKPDMVLFLMVDEQERYRRITGRRMSIKNLQTNELLLHKNPDYRNNVIMAYRNMVDPEITEVNATPPALEVLAEVLTKVKPLFKDDDGKNLNKTEVTLIKNILNETNTRENDSNESN